MSQVILVTSFKGGVGKTTLSANLAACYAKQGKRVLVCDCDLESRCLDMVLGMEEQPLFNICDAVGGLCAPEDAIREHERIKNLFFMPAPAFYPEAQGLRPTDEIFTTEAVDRFVKALTDSYDRILFDLPARPDNLYRYLVPCADKIVIVSMHTAVSIRAAEKTAIALREICPNKAHPDLKLAVNAFDAKRASEKDAVGLYDILNKAKLPLVGVIPRDVRMVSACEKGLLACEAGGVVLPFWRAVENTARRLDGGNVKLLEGVRTGVARSKLY